MKQFDLEDIKAETLTNSIIKKVSDHFEKEKRLMMLKLKSDIYNFKELYPLAITECLVDNYDPKFLKFLSAKEEEYPLEWEDIVITMNTSLHALVVKYLEVLE